MPEKERIYYTQNVGFSQHLIFHRIRWLKIPHAIVQGKIHPEAPTRVSLASKPTGSTPTSKQEPKGKTKYIPISKRHIQTVSYLVPFVLYLMNNMEAHCIPDLYRPFGQYTHTAPCPLNLIQFSKFCLCQTPKLQAYKSYVKKQSATSKPTSHMVTHRISGPPTSSVEHLIGIIKCAPSLIDVSIPSCCHHSLWQLM